MKIFSVKTLDILTNQRKLAGNQTGKGSKQMKIYVVCEVEGGSLIEAFTCEQDARYHLYWEEATGKLARGYYMVREVNLPSINGLTYDELIELEQKAARYDWLSTGKRRDYIWNNVLSDDDREPGDYLEECIDMAIERAKIGTS